MNKENENNCTGWDFKAIMIDQILSLQSGFSWGLGAEQGFDFNMT